MTDDGGREVAGRWPLGDADILYPRLISFCFFFEILDHSVVKHVASPVATGATV